jgi:hypothetical protein
LGWCIERTYVESWDQGQQIETHCEVAVVEVATVVVYLDDNDPGF